MAQFSIESVHTPAECLQALDDILAQGKDMLNKYNWGCWRVITGAGFFLKRRVNRQHGVWSRAIYVAGRA